MSKGKFDPLDPRCEDGGVACNDCICAGQCMSPPTSQPLANLQAAKPAEPRNFCPTCGKRLYKDSIHTCTPPADATQNATIHPAEPIAAQGTSENSATENATLQATDALGSLPVVAWRLVDVDDGSEMLLSWRPTFHEGSGDTLIPLTDHAQATAEINRWYGEAAALAFRLTPKAEAELRAKLAGVADALKPFADAFMATGIQSYRAAETDMAAFLDRNTITPVGPVMGDFRKAWEAMNGRSAMDAEPSTCDAAQGEKEPVL